MVAVIATVRRSTRETLASGPTTQTPLGPTAMWFWFRLLGVLPAGGSATVA